MILPAHKDRIQRRLQIISGQVAGVQRLVDDERPCMEVLTQIAAIQQALRGVAKEMTRNHLETCVTDAIRSGEGQAEVDELTELMFKLTR